MGGWVVACVVNSDSDLLQLAWWEVLSFAYLAFTPLWGRSDGLWALASNNAMAWFIWSQQLVFYSLWMFCSFNWDSLWQWCFRLSCFLSYFWIGRLKLLLVIIQFLEVDWHLTPFSCEQLMLTVCENISTSVQFHFHCEKTIIQQHVMTKHGLGSFSDTQPYPPWNGCGSANFLR